MSALRCSPVRLLAAAASNAMASPLPEHHRIVCAVLARAGSAPILASGDRWLLESFLTLHALSGRQHARLNDLASKVERGLP